MALVVPAVDDLHHILENLRILHPLRLLIRDILANRSVDVNQVVFAIFWKRWAHRKSPCVDLVDHFHHEPGGPRPVLELVDKEGALLFGVKRAMPDRSLDPALLHTPFRRA